MASKKLTPEAQNLYRNLTAAVKSMGKTINYAPRSCSEVEALYRNIKTLQKAMGTDHTEVTLLS